jgi:chitinase
MLWPGSAALAATCCYVRLHYVTMRFPVRLHGLAICLLLCSVCFGQYHVVGYYPMWLKGALPASHVRFEYLTHVMHAFAWPNADGSISTAEGAIADTAIINSTHRAGKKILLSFGGASESGAFPAVAADSVIRHTFVANVVARIMTYGYDGADMDWEGPSTNAEKANEVLLLRDLRQAFQQVYPDLLITMAIGPTNWSGQWHDFAGLQQYVDWFGAMTYDFHGGWSSQSGHNAPLYAPPGNFDGSVAEGIAYLRQTRGIPGSKITLGLPFYGKRFQSAGLYQPQTGEADLFFADVVGDMNNGWGYAWDTVSQVPYLTSQRDTQLDTFDDSLSLSIKCAYARYNNLAGVMIWALGEDIVDGNQPLLEAVGTAMSMTLSVSLPAREPLAEYMLYDSFPNPFNPSTTIRYSLPHRSQVRIRIFNTLGQLVTSPVDEVQNGGSHEVLFDARGLASGVYYCMWNAGGIMRLQKLILLR